MKFIKDGQPHDCVIAKDRQDVPVFAENVQELSKILSQLKPNDNEKCDYMKAQYEYRNETLLVHVPGNGQTEDTMYQIIQEKENPDGTVVGKIARVK